MTTPPAICASTLPKMTASRRGDPLRAVRAMMEVVESPNPPLRLLLGASALQRLRGKLDNWEKEIAAWEPVTVGADFPEGE